MSFSSNTSRSDQELITSVLGVTTSSTHDKYLGLPIVVGKNKKKAFQFIKSQFKSNMST